MPSVAYMVDDETLYQAVKNSRSIREVLLQVGLNETGSAYRVFKKRVKILGIDTSHFLGQGHLKGKSHDWAPKIPLKKILVKNSTYNNTVALKNRLIKEGLLKNRCECGLESIWNGKPITLQLDHINGHYDDNRITNLRILCPNCHSQTETFAGKNQSGGHDGSRTHTVLPGSV
jgi:hypothetical protein